MKILGIDPGIGRVGWGVIGDGGNRSIRSIKGTTGKKEFEVGMFGCFETHLSPGATDGERIYKIYQFLTELIEKEKPDEVAVESLFFAANTKTAIQVAQARGAILLTIAQAGLPVFSYTPLQVKQALTGYGRAEKGQVQKMVQVILAMDEVPRQDDAADALAVAICHSFSRKMARMKISN